MKDSTLRTLVILSVACAALIFFPLPLGAQNAPASSVYNYPGAGVISAGDVWESFLPQGYGPSYSEVGTASTLGVRRFIQMGNFDRGWSTPATHWPAAFPMTPYWLKSNLVTVYDPDTTWNRGPASGNPSFFTASAGYTGANYSNFALLTYKSTLNGASDAARHYSIEPYFVDGPLRQHVVYEAGWPTQIGVDVKMRAHGIAAPNWNNLNDYVIVEVQMTNTGALDVNMDGIAENVNHDIKALAFMIEEEAYMSISSYAGGGRNVNDIVPTTARQAGWVNDADASGAPWAFSMVFPSATSLNPVPGSGNTDIGFNGGTTKNYMDQHHGWVMLDVKSGSLPTDRSKSTSSLPSKQTIFGTHPIGLGAQRGWYVSGGSSWWAYTNADPMKSFYITTGVWYQNGGQLSHNTDFTQLNLSPNGNFFNGGTTGNPLTFVPKASPGHPNGDYKSTDHFDQISFEDGKADATANYPNGWGRWSTGCSHTENFDDDMFSGVGPFELKKDSTITVVYALVAGYRLEGIQRSVRAARFAYESSFNIPKPPPLPDLVASATLNNSIVVEWDNRAESDAEFSGYKIWRSSQSKTTSYLDEGMRVVDRYQEQDVVGPRPASVYKPVNPKFDAHAKMLANSTHGTYQPDTWGPWDLIRVIPKPELDAIPHAKTFGYKYQFEDLDTSPGSNTWYYVSAFKDGSYTGPDGETTTRIETHSTNRNGASGLWSLTYPFAFKNVHFPKDPLGMKNIGAAVTSLLPIAYDTLAVGNVVLGAYREMPVRFRNSAADTMFASYVTTNPSFVLRTSSLSVPPRDSILIDVRFSPTRLGVDTARLIFAIEGNSKAFTLFLTGKGISGTQAPNLAWEWIDQQPTLTLSNQRAAFDNAGNVYSAAIKSARIWEIRKFDAMGVQQWSFTDSVYAYGAFPQIAGLAADASGNVYVGLNGVSSGPPFSGAISVAKVTAGGQMQWKQSVMLPYDRAMSVGGFASDGSGNTYATGQAYSRSTGNNTCITTAKINQNGSIGWVASFEGRPVGTDSSDAGRAVAVDSLGNVYVTGASGYSTQNGNIVTLKYNSAGVLLWATNYDDPSSLGYAGSAIAVAQNGDIYVVGQSYVYSGATDIFLLKYSASDGSLLWADRYDGMAHKDDRATSLVACPTGDVFVCGTTTLVDGTTDAVLLKYTPQGSRQVLLQYDGPLNSNDAFGVLACDQEGNVYTGGNCMGSLGVNEVALFKFSTDGRLVWENHYLPHQSGINSVSSLAVGTSGRLAVTGLATSASYNLYVAAFGEIAVTVSPNEQTIPSTCALLQNYPNPFNPTTGIRYQLSGVSDVKIAVYDILGREVAVLVNEKKQPGSYEVQFDGSNFASGVLIYRLKAGSFVQSRKMLLIK